jgi:hypothetical protein
MCDFLIKRRLYVVQKESNSCVKNLFQILFVSITADCRPTTFPPRREGVSVLWQALSR